MNLYKIYFNNMKFFITIFFLIMINSLIAENFVPINLSKIFFSSPEDERYIAISGEKDIVIYSSNQTGYYNLYIRKKDEFGNYIIKRLTFDEFADNIEPVLCEKQMILAFTSYSNDVRGNIEIIKFTDDYEVAERRELTGNKTEDRSPTISNDGKNIYYVETDLSGQKSRLNFIELATGKIKTVVEKRVSNPLVSADNDFIIFITKENNYKIELLNLKDNSIETIYEDNNEIRNLMLSANNDYLYFTKIINAKSVLYNIDFKNRGKNRALNILQITPENLDVINPIIKNNNIYFISKILDSSENSDIFVIEGIDVIPRDWLINLNADELNKIINSLKLNDDYKKIIINNYFVLKYNELNSIEKRKFKLNVCEYFSYFKKYDELKNILKNINSDSMEELYYNEANYYLSIINKSYSEKQNIKNNFFSYLLKISQNIQNDTPLILKSKEIIADINFDNSLIPESLKIYDEIFYATSDNQFKSKMLYKKSAIYKLLNDRKNYVNILGNIIKNYPDIQPYSDLALKDIVNRFKTEKNNFRKIDIINYLNELSEKYKDEIPLLSVRCLLEAGSLAFEIHENYYAKNLLEKAISKYSGFNDEMIEAYILVGDIYFQEEDFKESFKYYKNAIDIGSKDVRKYELALSKYKNKLFEKGEFEFFIKDYEMAYKTYFELIEFDSKYVCGHRELIKIASMIGKLEEIENYYKNKIAELPTANDAFEYSQGLILTYKKEIDLNSALKYVNRAIQLKRDVSYYYQLAGWICEQMEMINKKSGRLETAIDNYKIALNLTDSDNVKSKSELLLNIGNAYYYLKNYDFSFKFYNKRLALIDLLPQEYFDAARESLYYERLGNSAYYTGYSNIAEPYLKKAIELTTDINRKKELLQKLGLIYYTEEKYYEAIKISEQALSLESKETSLIQQYYSKRSLLLYFVNYLNQSKDKNEIEKLKLRDKLLKLSEEIKQQEKENYKLFKEKKDGFVNVSVNLNKDGYNAAEGFDAVTEKKFIMTIVRELYELYGDNESSAANLRERLSLIPENINYEKTPVLALEKSILLNNLAIALMKENKIKESTECVKQSIEIAIKLKNDIGIYMNLINYIQISARIMETDKNIRTNSDIKFALADILKYYNNVNEKNIYFDFIILNSVAYLNYKIFSDLIYYGEKNFELNILDEDTSSLSETEPVKKELRHYEDLMKLYRYKVNAVQHLQRLKKMIAEFKNPDETIKLFDEITDINLNVINNNYNVDIKKCEWYKLWKTGSYEDLVNSEKKFIEFINYVEIYPEYNFISFELLKNFYDELVSKSIEFDTSYISTILYIDNFQKILNYILSDKQKKFNDCKFLNAEDIYYLQSLLPENIGLDIFYKTEYELYNIKISQSEINSSKVSSIRIDSTAAYICLVNISEPGNYLNNNYLIPSISSIIKAKENQTIFYEKIKAVETLNFDKLLSDTDADIIYMNSILQINENNPVKSKIIFNDNTFLPVTFFENANFKNVNFIVFNEIRNQPENSNILNFVIEKFLCNGISNVIIDKNFKLYNSIFNSKNKKFIFGLGGFTELERRQIAEEKVTEYLNTAVENYKSNNFRESLKGIIKIISLKELLNFDYDTQKKYLKFAVNCAYKSEDYDKAILYQEQYLTLIQNTESKKNYINELYNAGIFYSQAENYDSAIYYFEQSLKNADNDTRLIEKSKIELAKSKEFSGDYKGSINYIESVIKSQPQNSTENIGEQYLRLGKIYYLRLNDYFTAQDYFLKAKEYFHNKQDEYNLCQSIINLGLIDEQFANFDEARKNYDAALKIAQNIKNNNLTAWITLNIANTYWFEGDYKTAFDKVFNSLEISRQAKDEQGEYLSLNTIGLIYWTLNNFEKSIYYLNKSLDISQNLKVYNDVSSTFNNLGLIYRTFKKYNDAELYFKKAIEIDSKLKSKWGLGYDYRNIGMVYLALDNLQEAKKYLNDAYNISAGINDNVNTVKCLLELGNLNLKLNEKNLAMDFFDKSLDLSKKYNMQEIIWRSLFGKANCRIDKNKIEALNYLKEAIEIVEQMRTTLKIEELKNGFIIDKKELYDRIITLLVDMNNTDGALEYLERFKSRSLIDLLGNHKIRFKNNDEDLLYKKYYDIKKEKDNILKQVNTVQNPEKKKELNEKLQRMKIVSEEILLKLKLQNPELESLVNVSVLSLTDAQNIIDTQTALIEYYFSEQELYLWIIAKEGVNFYKKKIDVEKLKERILEFNKRIQKKSYIEDISEDLYKVLLEPAEKYFINKKYIGIIPYDKLHYLSFAALKNKDYYLIEKYPVFYLASMSLIKYVSEGKNSSLKKENLRVLAVGNPDLGTLNYDLPLARLEAKSIKWDFPVIDILLDKEARESWIIKNISKYDIIHLATHGEFDSINPLFSAIKLSKDDNYDGDLKALDVFNLEINADLVTLSACQSGLGKIEVGDEIIGLNRAFFYAGTKSIVSSLWRIDDLSTSLLMKHFYRNYLENNKIESLRNAQLTVKSLYPHPMYWAGVFLSGRWY